MGGGTIIKSNVMILECTAAVTCPHDFHKLKSAQNHYVPIPCIKFHPIQTINMKSIDGISFTLLSMAFTAHLSDNSQLLDKFLYTSSLLNVITAQKYSSIIP
jgi:hypothetical protein